MKLFQVFTVSLFLLTQNAAFAQDTYQPQRQELRNLLQVIENGINNKDVSAIEPYVNPETTIVFQDAVRTTGKEEFSTYFQRTLGSGNALISDMSAKATIGGPAVFYADNVAVAFGELNSTYKLKTGKSIDLVTQWTTTVVKKEDKWGIASLHFSNNLFDNPILNASKRSIWLFAIAGLILYVFSCLAAWLGCCIWPRERGGSQHSRLE